LQKEAVVAVHSKSSDDGRQVTITIQGRFDFSQHRPFREAYGKQGVGTHYTVDMSGADYMDSSALGMLLLLREHAGGDTAKVAIRKPSPAIKKILDIANFDRLFKFE
jgi:anti-anti-sigma factor